MNRRITTLFLAACLSSVAGAQDDFSQIRFAQSNQLSGRMLSFTGDRILWSSPVLEEPASFLVKRVLDVSFPSATPDYEADHEATLVLMNGDVVRGQLASVTDEEIQLSTWYAGTMKFRRVMVEKVSIEDRPKLFFRGPSGMDGWVQANNGDAWSLRGSALQASKRGSIGRNVETPDECRFAFTASWRGDFRLALNLFSPNLESSDPDAGYRLNFEPQMMSVQKRGGSILGTANAGQRFTLNEKVRIEVRVSQKKGSITLLINDEVIDTWVDPEPEKGAEELGDGMQFTAVDEATIQLSRIEVSSWDGHVEPRQGDMNGVQFGGGRMGGFNNFGRRIEPQVEPEPEEEEGKMALRNGDSVVGEVLSIKDGLITIKTAYNEVSLPVARLRTLTLKPASLEEPKRNAGDVRAWFEDGSSLVFRLEGIQDGVVKGYSQTFGTVDFKADAFNRIEFNVHDIPLQAIRGESGW